MAPTTYCTYSTPIVYWEIPQKNSEDIEEKKSYDISQKRPFWLNVKIFTLFLPFLLLTIPESCLWEAPTAIYLLIDIHIYEIFHHCPSIWLDLHSKTLISNSQCITNYSREKKITKLINIHKHKSPLETSGVTNFPTKFPKLRSMWIFLWRNTKMLCSVPWGLAGLAVHLETSSRTEHFSWQIFSCPLLELELTTEVLQVNSMA